MPGVKLDTLSTKSLGSLLQRCSRHVAGRLFGHTDRRTAAADVRLPYCVCFFTAAQPVPARTARPPLARRARRSRHRRD